MATNWESRTASGGMSDPRPIKRQPRTRTMRAAMKAAGLPQKPARNSCTSLDYERALAQRDQQQRDEHRAAHEAWLREYGASSAQRARRHMREQAKGEA